MVFSSWCNTIEKITQRLVKHAKGWEHIVQPEALKCLTIWLTNSEIKLLQEHLLVKNQLQTYPDVQTMITKCTVGQFIAAFRNIKPDRLPKGFRQALQKKALRRTMVSHELHAKTLTKLKACQEEIVDLKAKNASLKKGNR